MDYFTVLDFGLALAVGVVSASGKCLVYLIHDTFCVLIKGSASGQRPLIISCAYRYAAIDRKSTRLNSSH